MPNRAPNLVADQVGRNPFTSANRPQAPDTNSGAGSLDYLRNMGSGGGGFNIPSIGSAPQFNLQTPNTPGQFQVHTPDYEQLDQSFSGIMDSYGAFRDAITSQHATGQQELQQQLEYLLGDIDTTRGRARQDLTKSRQQIMEDSFDAQRGLQAQMSARGLAGSGMEQLGNIQQRMAQGDSLSNIANDYYRFEEEMTERITQAQSNYNLSMQKLNDSLQGAMAQIMSQEASTRMDYDQMVDNLQRQVIADANATLEAQRGYDMSLAQYEIQRAQFENAMYEFNVQAQFQQASLEAQRAQMAQSAAQANRQFEFQLRQYEDQMASMNQAPGYVDALTIIKNPDLTTQERTMALQEMGFSQSDVNNMIEQNRLGVIHDLQRQVNNLANSDTPHSDIQAFINQYAGYIDTSKITIPKTTTPRTANEPTPASLQRAVSSVNQQMGTSRIDRQTLANQMTGRR